MNMTEALEILKQGGIVAHATETCYGLACDLRNADAVQKLFNIKQREFDKPVSALFACWKDATAFVQTSEAVEELALSKLPGPYVFVLNRKEDAPSNLHLTADGELYPTIGVRVSSHPTAIHLVTAYGSPLSTTSANLAGEPPCYSAEEIRRQFDCSDLKPDLILDDGEIQRNSPSEILDLSGQ